MHFNKFSNDIFERKIKKFNSHPLEKFEKKLKFKVICKNSFNIKDLYFTNKLESKYLTNIISSQVYDILNIDGKEYDFDHPPIDDIGKNDFLELNKDFEKRIPEILKLYGETFEDGHILKCYPHSELEHKIGGKGLKGDKVRIFVKKNENEEWVIVLIDPNHLVAETTYKSDYEKYKNFQIDFKQLKTVY